MFVRWDGSNWDLRRTTAFSLGTQVTTFNAADGFSEPTSPWGAYVKPASWAHTGAFPHDDAVYQLVNGDVNAVRFDGTSVYLGDDPTSRRPHFDRGLGDVGWFADDGRTAAMHDDFELATDNRYFAHGVDDRQPIWPTTRTAPGDPFIVYHTSDPSPGFVLGYSDQTGCAE
jgi:hypothetical protein